MMLFSDCWLLQKSETGSKPPSSSCNSYSITIQMTSAKSWSKLIKFWVHQTCFFYGASILLIEPWTFSSKCIKILKTWRNFRRSQLPDWSQSRLSFWISTFTKEISRFWRRERQYSRSKDQWAQPDSTHYHLLAPLPQIIHWYLKKIRKKKLLLSFTSWNLLSNALVWISCWNYSNI